MKTVLTAVVLAAVTALSGCAVVPYDPDPYYAAEPYYGSRRYYVPPPAVIVTEPIFVPRFSHRHRHDGHRGYRGYRGHSGRGDWRR